MHLVAGLADALRASNILAFGEKSASNETRRSKYFARDFCKRYDIPQPNLVVLRITKKPKNM